MYKINNKADCSDRITIAIANNGRRMLQREHINKYICKTIIKAFGNGLGELVYLDGNDNYIWYCFDTMDTLKQMEIGVVVYGDFEIALKD